MQEYPKALYLAGQQLIAEDSEQEDAARADGYDDWHADNASRETSEDAAAQLEATAADAEALAETENRLREWDLQLTAREDDLTAREAALAEAIAHHEAAQQAALATAKSPADDAGHEGATEPPPDRDALKARAAALGLTFAPNITTDKLAALVAASETHN